MTTYRADKFQGTSTANNGFSIKKPFRPDYDLRCVGYWDATNVAKRTVVTGTGGIPKLTALANMVEGGAILTTYSIAKAPASQDASSELGIAWRSDSANEGVQALLLPAGLLPSASEVMIAGIIKHTTSLPVNGQLFGASSDGTATGVTAGMDWQNFATPTMRAHGWPALPANLNVPNIPIGSKYAFLLHFSGGVARMRINGVETASIAANTSIPLIPAGGSGSIGGSFNGLNNGIARETNTLLTHFLIASVGQIPSVGVGVVEAIRDRNSAAYWEAAMLWDADLQSLLPSDHPFKTSAPITTWLGERV